MVRLLIVTALTTGCAATPRRCDIPVAIGVPEDDAFSLELWQIQIATDYWNDVTGIDLFVNLGRVPLQAGRKYSPVVLFTYREPEDLNTCMTTINYVRHGCIIKSEASINPKCGDPETTQTAVRDALGRLLLISGFGKRISPEEKHPKKLSRAAIEAAQRRFSELR